MDRSVSFKRCRCGFKNEDLNADVCQNCGRNLAGVSITLQSSSKDVTGKDTVLLEPQPYSPSEATGATPGLTSTIPSQPQPYSSSTASEANPSVTGTNKPTKEEMKRRKSILFTLISLVLVIIIILVAVIHNKTQPSTPSIPTPQPTKVRPNNVLREFKAPDSEIIGVNDGSLPPFIVGDDLQLKQLAADQVKQGNTNQAITLLTSATHKVNKDPEAWIYLENQKVLFNRSPYITFVAGTNVPELEGSGQNDLQGIYIAQHEFNTANHGFQIRILIANSGTDIDNVKPVAQQIVGLAQQDTTIKGVISWLTSAENLNALPILSAASLPMIAPSASSDQLSGISPYFFRVVPPNEVQGKAIALFAEHTLHVHNAVVFVDRGDPYSQNIADVFEKQFKYDKNVILKEEPFTTDHLSNIKTLIQDALATNPDVLYFTTRDNTDSATFQDALPTSGPFAQLPVLAGDAGYVIHSGGYGRWYFASSAFDHELSDKVDKSLANPPFYQYYIDAFNEDKLEPAGRYGNTKPNDTAMLSYDVTSVFLNGIQKTITKNKLPVTLDGLKLVTPTLLANALPSVVLQGITGMITFDPDHNPINKTIVFLTASSDGHTYMKDWQGCFTKDLCHTVS